MKVLFVITGLGVGGAERQVIDIADRLSQRGHTILIVYLTGKIHLEPTQPDVKLVGLGMQKTLAGLWTGYCRLRRLTREFDPDVVHSHMVHANLLARMLKLTMRVPRLICTVHSTNEGGKLRMLAYRITDSLADMTTNVSVAAVASFVAQGAVKSGRVAAVYNGIDIDGFQRDANTRTVLRDMANIDAGVKIVLAVGRLTEAKDYPNLLNAYAALEWGNTESQLWIVGDGELRSVLQKLVDSMGLAGRVRFLGIRFDVAALMNAADVFVLSSAWEGFSLVVAEAMACEKVVVATDCGGVKEVLGAFGYLVPPRDSMALAHALSLALNLSTEDILLMGARARQHILSNYSLDAAVEKWLRIYNGDVNLKTSC